MFAGLLLAQIFSVSAPGPVYDT